MDRLRSIEAFVRIADTRSFAEAARQLGVAKSVVTTRIQQLDDFVRAQLFHRTTRATAARLRGRWRRHRLLALLEGAYVGQRP